MKFYEKYVKRYLDIICALVFIVLFGWIYIVLAILVHANLGSPILFKQPRPGLIYKGKERIFNMYKFRSMTSEKNSNGELLPDSYRLTKFGKILRSTSLDEIPEVFSILKGDMSIVGPRPQLVRDMVFMSPKQRMRHTAKPGLTGLAQVKGRNLISWDEKINWDLKYIEKVSFIGDVKILFQTLLAVFRQKGITDGENATTLDYGDVLLKEKRITKKQYDILLERANIMIKKYDERD